MCYGLGLGIRRIGIHIHNLRFKVSGFEFRVRDLDLGVRVLGCILCTLVIYVILFVFLFFCIRFCNLIKSSKFPLAIIFVINNYYLIKLNIN